MLPEFMLRAFLAGAGVALAAGPLGAFVVWRRMAYFSDATAHAALLGVALAVGFSTSVLLGTLAVALAIGFAISGLARRGHAADSTLGVLSHLSLAAGLVAVSLFGGTRIDLTSFLFGDVLAVGWMDLAIIWCGAILVSGLIAFRWQALLTATLNEELATSAGFNPARDQMILTLTLAIVVAVALKVVGALLIGAMLLIPAVAARAFARSPEVMVFIAVLIGVASTGLGLGLSWQWDTPAGPSIVVAAGGIYILSLLRPRR